MQLVDVSNFVRHMNDAYLWLIHCNFVSIFHLVGNLASNLDVVVDFHCEVGLYHKMRVYHRFACSIGTSCNCEFDQHVEEFDGPGADNRPSRCGSPIVHVRAQLSRNLDVDLGKTLKYTVIWGQQESIIVIESGSRSFWVKLWSF